MRRLLLLLLAAVGAGWGSVDNLRVESASATQAILAYTAPSTDDCTIKASETNDFGAGYAPLHDVDTALFAGSDQDSRSGAHRSGRERWFVLGTRYRAFKALDNRYYSRALQAYTHYYAQVACGADTAAIDFWTQTIPLGNLAPDPIPTDPSDPGSTAWPTLDWTPTGSANYANSPTMVTDPQTGVGIRLMTPPKYTLAATQQIGYTIGASWTTPDNVIADDSASASYTGSGSGAEGPWMFAAPTGMPSYDLNYGPLYSYNQFMSAKLNLKGSVAGGGGGSDNLVEYCLTWDGVACGTVLKTQDLTACGGSGCTLGDDIPDMSFWRDSANPLGVLKPKWNWVGRSAVVNYAASTKIVTWVSGQFFDPVWAAGSHIYLQVGGTYTLYTVASVDSYKQITLAAGPATDQTGVNFIGYNFGILFRKKSATANTINLQYVQFQVPQQHSLASFYGGFPNTCGPGTVTQTSTSRLGYHCFFGLDPAQHWWIEPTLGDATYIGDATGTYFGTSQRCAINTGGWHSGDDPNKFYCDALSGTDRHGVEVTYTGDNSDVAQRTSILTNGSYSDLGSLKTEVTDFMATDSGGPPYLSWWNATFRSYAQHPSQPYATILAGAQDQVSAGAVMNTTTGNVIAAASFHGYWPMRYCTMHGGSIYTGADGPFVQFSTNNIATSGSNTTCGMGPLKTEFTATIPATATDSCATNTFGTTGHGCTNITVVGEPYDDSPCASENSNRGAAGPYGTFQVIREGDVFKIDSEYVQVLSKSGNNLNLLRGVDTYAGTSGATLASHSTSSPMYGMCANYALGGGSFGWDFLTYPHGNAGITGTLANHQAQSSQSQKTAVANYGVGYEMYSSEKLNDYKTLGTNYERAVNNAPTFAGIASREGFEIHANWGSYLSGEANYFISDLRPFTYSPGASEPLFSNVSGTLYSSLLSGTYALNRKLAATDAFCGMYPLQDVSGPSSSITGSASDRYKYCVVNNAGECVAGSNPAVANVYLNCPNLTRFRCHNDTYGTDTNYNVLQDPCVYDLAPLGNQALQLKFGAPTLDKNGVNVRLLGHRLSRNRLQNVYANAHILPDASWLLVHTMFLDGVKSAYLGLKLPPFGATVGTGHTFERVPVNVSPGPTGTTNAIVEFGYAEHGSPSSHYCTTRAEACAVDTASFSESSPFKWATTEALTGVSCASGCTIEIPRIPGRVVYASVKYRSVTGVVLATLDLPPIGSGAGMVEAASGVPPAGYFASPSGTGTACTFGQPCTLDTACSPGLGSPIVAGDTLWLRGGTYNPSVLLTFVCGLVGTPASPVRIRPYPGESVKIDGGFTFTTAARNTWLQGVEITDSYPASRWTSVVDGGGIPRRGGVAQDTVSPSADLGNKVINCIIHDTGHPGIWWPNLRTGGEVYGSLVYNVGWLDDNWSGHPECTHSSPCIRGSGIYGQNDSTTATVNVEANMWFRNFTTGVNAYGEGGHVWGWTTQGNGSFQNADEDFWHAATTDDHIDALAVTGNYSYKATSEDPACGARVGYGADQLGATVTNNYFVGGKCGTDPIAYNRSLNTLTFTGNTVVGSNIVAGRREPSDGTSTTTWNNNTYYGGWLATGPTYYPFYYHDGTSEAFYDFADWKSTTGYDAASTYSASLPSTNQIFYVAANKYVDQYQPKKLHVFVYNWESLSSVALDLSSVFNVGDKYTIRDAQCYLTCSALASGTYAGGTVSVAMTGTDIDDPEFGTGESAFVDARVLAHTDSKFGAFVISNE